MKLILQKYAPQFTLLLLSVIFLQQIYTIQSIGYGLSPIADSYSESNALRAGLSYSERGFSYGSGLPFIFYKGAFPGKGVLEGISPEESRGSLKLIDMPYTHYPPGPDLLVGVSTSIFGPENIPAMRLIPLMIGIIALIFLWRTLAQWKSEFFAFVSIFIMFSFWGFHNFFHGLHYQSLALSLLLLSTSVLLRELSFYKKLALLFLLSFLQGWLSFDYCFLVTALPFAIELIRRMVTRLSLKTLFLELNFWILSFFSGLGFTIAHGLHFLQNVHHFGGFSLALADFRQAAGERASIEISRWTVVWKYWSDYTLDSAGFKATALAALLIYFIAGKYFRVAKNEIVSDLTGLTAVLVYCSLWIAAMPQHGFHHTHFLPKHFAIFYFAVAVLLARNFSERIQNQELK